MPRNEEMLIRGFVGTRVPRSVLVCDLLVIEIEILFLRLTIVLNLNLNGK